MEGKHLLKTVTHPLRVSTKIKKQSNQVLDKLPRKIDTGLLTLVAAMCSNSLH